MKKTITLTAIVCTLVMNAQTKITYPETKKIDHVDTYFGENINDPYHWLEDDRSAETGTWVKRQNDVTYRYLSAIPLRDQLKSRMEKLWNYEKISAPFKEGDYTYYYKNNGLQNQSVLFRKDKSGKEELFLDPNTFSKDGTSSLGGISFSKDGSLVAYEISEGGSDWRKVIVLDTKTKKIIGNPLVDVKFSGIAWFKNEGFYYSSYDKPVGSELSAKTDQHKLYYHKLKAAQKTDKLIFGGTIKRRYVGGSVSDEIYQNRIVKLCP
jgi:prolyl oligopeptidase